MMAMATLYQANLHSVLRLIFKTFIATSTSKSVKTKNIIMKSFLIKKEIHFITVATLLFFSTIFSSCQKILNQEPKNSPYLQVFWKSVSDCQSALSGDYSLLRAALSYKEDGYYMYGDAVPGNYFIIQYNGDGLETIQTGDFTTTYNVTSLGNWSRFYQVIAMSNLILKEIPTIDNKLLENDVDDVETFKNSIMGQALFIRAYTYFTLTRIWGDVPLDIQSYDNPINAPQLGRSDKDTVMAQIEKDCHQAAKLLDWGYENEEDRAVTANKGAVYALLAHLYLWRATMSNVSSDQPIMKDVNSADTTIDKLMANGGYSLADTASYAKVFIGQSSESIFEINRSEDDREGDNAAIGLGFLPTKYLATAGDNPRFYVVKDYLSTHFGFGGGEWVWDSNSNQWVWNTAYDSTDVRYRKIFTEVAQTQPVCLKYSNVVYRNPSAKTDPYLSNNMILLRYADMVLLKAEIAIYKNNLPAAINIIDNLRQKRGANPNNVIDPNSTRDDVMYQYILERGKELYLEGQLYWDLLRTRTYGDFITWMSPARFRKEGFYWPVDPSLFSDNIHLSQTNYWKGKL
jgi:hypothetical protein